MFNLYRRLPHPLQRYWRDHDWPLILWCALHGRIQIETFPYDCRNCGEPIDMSGVCGSKCGRDLDLRMHLRPRGAGFPYSREDLP